MKHPMARHFKHALYFCGILAVSACTQPEKNATSPEKNGSQTATHTDTLKQNNTRQRIVPGQRIGRIALGENADSLRNFLGKPDATGAAMGSGSMTWKTQNDRVTVFYTHNMGMPDEQLARIRRIRVTSPEFHTANGFHTGLPITDYPEFGTLKTLRTGVPKDDRLRVYQLPGLTFETDPATQRCTAITVHRPEDSAYVNLE